jgi:hypothetical protein
LETALLASLCGCSSDDESAETSSGLAGMYQTTAHAESQPCDGAAAALPLDPPYFLVVDDEFSPSTVINVHACEDSFTCLDYPFVEFAEKIGNGTFHTEQTTQDGTEESCHVTWTGSDVRKAGSSVEIEEETRSGDWTGADCAGHLTNADIERARMLPCAGIQTWTGEKL